MGCMTMAATELQLSNCVFKMLTGLPVLVLLEIPADSQNMVPMEKEGMTGVGGQGPLPSAASLRVTPRSMWFSTMIVSGPTSSASPLGSQTLPSAWTFRCFVTEPGEATVRTGGVVVLSRTPVRTCWSHAGTATDKAHRRTALTERGAADAYT